MEVVGGIAIVIGQVVFFGVIIWNFIRSVRSARAFQQRWVFEIIVTLLTMLCFLMVKNMRLQPGLFPEQGFQEYMMLTLVTLACYWSGKIQYLVSNKWCALFFGTMTGAFSFLALFTAFKFVLIFPLAVFPWFGFLIAAPYLATVMGFSEVLRRYQLTALRPAHVLLSGLLFLVVFQLVMNLWTPEPWLLVEIFNPKVELL